MDFLHYRNIMIIQKHLAQIQLSLDMLISSFIHFKMKSSTTDWITKEVTTYKSWRIFDR